MILNVTPQEFADIQELAQKVELRGMYRDADFVRDMSLYYGCEPYTHYKVVVHWHIDHIPFHSVLYPEQSVPRIEPEPTA